MIRPLRAARALAAIAAALAVSLVPGVVLAPAAQAHTSLVSSTPADGAVLAAAPTALTLRFDEDVLAQGAGVVAKATDGTAVTLGTPAVDGPTVSVPWPAGTPGGAYQVAWRVVADDGHPITGTFAFSYQPAPTASPAPTGSTAPTGTPTTTSAPTASPTTAAAGPEADGGSSRVPAVVAALAVVVLATVLVVVAVRRRGSP